MSNSVLRFLFGLGFS